MTSFDHCDHLLVVVEPAELPAKMNEHEKNHHLDPVVGRNLLSKVL